MQSATSRSANSGFDHKGMPRAIRARLARRVPKPRAPEDAARSGGEAPVARGAAGRVAVGPWTGAFGADVASHATAYASEAGVVLGSLAGASFTWLDASLSQALATPNEGSTDSAAPKERRPAKAPAFATREDKRAPRVDKRRGGAMRRMHGINQPRLVN